MSLRNPDRSAEFIKSIPPLEERRAQQERDGRAAMAEYKRAFDNKLERMARLRAVRLARDRGETNAPNADRAQRKQAIRQKEEGTFYDIAG